jgi:hypothetical protein
MYMRSVKKPSLTWASIVVLGLLPGLAASARAEDPADLPAVPPRACALIHIRLADIWNNPALDEFRQPAGAGPRGEFTFYRVYIGPEAGFEMCKSRRLTEITDGTSNTWMVVTAAEGVEWTKPDELPYDAKKPLPKLGNFFGGGFNTAMMDGSVHYFLRPSERTMRALITPAGGEEVRPDDGVR